MTGKKSCFQQHEISFNCKIVLKYNVFNVLISRQPEQESQHNDYFEEPWVKIAHKNIMCNSKAFNF